MNKNKLPAMLVLKRKAIRIYPNNIIVGLYYNSQLDKWVTIPYEGIGINEDIQEDMEELINE